MARSKVKKDWGQAKGGWSPFGTSSPKAKAKAKAKAQDVGVTICPTCDGAGRYEAYNRVTQQWFTYDCRRC